jgi:hypothetical protein
MRILTKFVAAGLLSVLLVTSAGATCMWFRSPVLAAQTAPQGCHQKLPSHPLSGPRSNSPSSDFSCCTARHPSALPTNIFSPVLAVKSFPADRKIAAAPLCSAANVVSLIPPSCAPPGAAVLRI